jgi:hypothetical protein
VPKNLPHFVREELGTATKAIKLLEFQDLILSFREKGSLLLQGKTVKLEKITLFSSQLAPLSTLFDDDLC